MPRIAPDTVGRIASEATRAGSVVGVRREIEDAEPWRRRESGPAPRARVTEPLSRQVHAVLAQGLFVEKAGLPSPMIVDQIQRLAAFQNPGFYKRQRMRLSTATTPRVIACAEDLPLHVALPRG